MLNDLHVSIIDTVAVSLTVVTAGGLPIRESVNCSMSSGRSSSRIVMHTHWRSPFLDPERNLTFANKDIKSTGPGSAKVRRCISSIISW